MGIFGDKLRCAKVICSGRDSMPADGRSALRIETDLPYLLGGEVGTSTGIYVDPACPEPKSGDPISWRGHSVWLNGQRWDRYGLEFNPDAPLH